MERQFDLVLAVSVGATRRRLTVMGGTADMHGNPRCNGALRFRGLIP